MSKKRNRSVFSQERVVKRVRRIMSRMEDKPGLCLLWAGAVVAVLVRMGVRAIVQAGSCSWPRLPPEMDDGKVNTHFSYVFEPYSPATIQRLTHNELPEMHVWAAIPGQDVIIDMTTFELPTMCKTLAGMDWLSPPPPEYFWCEIGSKDWPNGVLYKPHPIACRIARDYIVKIAQEGSAG